MTVTTPASLEAAVEALAATPAAQVLAGGTDFMVELNDGRRRPSAVVCTRAVPSSAAGKRTERRSASAQA